MVKVKGEMLLMVTMVWYKGKGRDVAHGNNGVVKVKGWMLLMVIMAW